MFIEEGKATNHKHASLLILAALCLFLSLSSAPAATWSQQRSGTMAWLHAVYFLDQNHGWAAGSNGTLLETRDGGKNWLKLPALTQDNFNDVYFADESTGWLIAERDLLKLKTNDEPRSYLLKTQDGGATWHQILLNNPETNALLVRAVFADAQRGWVFGETGAVFATSDGGSHWTQQSPPTKHLLLGGVFSDHVHGWLAGASATILQTNNGGMSWQTAIVREGGGARLNAISFVGNRLGWAVGNNGRIFATTDGGLTWFPQHSNVDSDLLDIKFIDAADGWAVGAAGLLLHTIDGGLHWTPQSSATSHALNRVIFIDRNHGWAVGFGGTILSYGDNSSPRLR